MSTKNPLTLVGIEPATFRFVEQHLNHCATAVPAKSSTSQYSVESTVTSTIAYVLCFFYHILFIIFISVLTSFHILIMRIHGMHVSLFIYQSVNQSIWLGRQQVEALMLHLSYKISFHPYLKNIVSDHALK